ncbi:3-oxoacyl-[acyl-carrier-protein] reductase [Fusobacterium sp. PH5-44]|uniref:3-oxoacyl-[acyl-carrier-protein] reductase n=1 Tax=unclassified Fusobacterium TaxID=2648384 RepID=UPI003D1EADB8
MDRLKGKIALVTGSARGIGRAIVERFAAEGATMVFSCDMVEAEYKESNVTHDIMDVTNKDSIKAFVNKIVTQYGRIDILINNAGITKDAPFVRMSEEQWDAVINVNLKGVFNVTQVVAPVMSKNKYGSIVTLSSIVGLMGNIGQTNYAATKGGVIAMSKSWAKELARKGAQIRANCVAPGFIETPMTHQLPEKVVEGMLERTPLKRMGQVEDVVNAILFLASDESSFITGETIAVTGGMVI